MARLGLSLASIGFLRRGIQKTPGLRALPPRVIGIISLLVVINCVTWAGAGVVLHYYPRLITPVVLSYTLGLRHALDADHISAIDLMTRRLIASGQRPVSVGTFFSLGHSTIVIITCVVVAATSGALRERFDNFRKIGGIIGTSVSAAFLLVLCLGNGWVLHRLVKRLREALDEQHRQPLEGEEEDNETLDEEQRYHDDLRTQPQQGQLQGDQEQGQDPKQPEQVTTELVGSSSQGNVDVIEGVEHQPIQTRKQQQTTTTAAIAELEGGNRDSAVDNLKLEGAGFMANLFRKLFRVVDRPWKMFPLGLMFGLGFDTSSEIAILGIASIQGAQGTSLWLILVFPVLFTAGMCLLDTTDGALMMALYTSKAFARDTVAILYYSIVLTGITVFVSAFIGIIQVLSLVYNVAEPEGSFWDGVEAIGDNFDIIGGSICGVFVLAGVGSVIVYRPWRRRMERRALRRSQQLAQREGEGEA